MSTPKVVSITQPKAGSGLKSSKQASVSDTAAGVEESEVPMDAETSTTPAPVKPSTVAKEPISTPGVSST